MPAKKAREAVKTETQEAVEPTVTVNPPYVPPPKEKFWEVMFHEKSNPNDTNDVTLCVNGENLLIQRGKRVVLPDRFLECARHTKYPTYSQEAGKDRKIVAWITTYPFEKISESTEETYKRQKRSGDKIAKDVLKKREGRED